MFQINIQMLSKNASSIYLL